MTKVIDATTALATLKEIVTEAVAQHGPAVSYATIAGQYGIESGDCQYVVPSAHVGSGAPVKPEDVHKPLCIVGQAFVRWGIDPEFLDDDVHFLSTGMGVAIANYIRKEKDIDITRQARRVLEVAQIHQDQGDTWPDVIEILDARRVSMLD